MVFEIVRLAGLAVDAQRADGPAFQLDGDTEKGDWLTFRGFSRPGLVKEARVSGYIGDNGFLAGLDDGAGYALTDFVYTQPL